MTTGKKYIISTIADIADLAPSQRAQCLVDLTQWIKLRDAMQSFVDDGVMDPITEMIWVDDGRTGEVSEIRIIDRETGETVMQKDLQ